MKHRIKPIKFEFYDDGSGDLRCFHTRAPKGIGYVSLHCVVIDGVYHAAISYSKNIFKTVYVCEDFDSLDKAEEWVTERYIELLDSREAT
ncbi:MAG: hypothetical protein ACPKOP_04105 [Sphaerochaetaceae bacterium]